MVEQAVRPESCDTADLLQLPWARPDFYHAQVPPSRDDLPQVRLPNRHTSEGFRLDRPGHRLTGLYLFSFPGPQSPR
jgi:hypothetical protein